MAISLKVGGLYSSPERYHLSLQESVRDITMDLSCNCNPNRSYVSTTYQGSLSPLSKFTILEIVSRSWLKYGKISLFRILTIDGRMGWIFLPVPNDCKEVNT